MSGPDASLIPPGPPPLDAPPPIPERRRLRWWTVALGTILIAALVLGAGLALAAVLRDDDSPAANRPDIDLPGGESGVAPAPIDDFPALLPSGSTTTTIGGARPGAPVPTASPSGPTPTAAPRAPAPQNPPVTNRPPIGPGQIPSPTAAPRCALTSGVTVRPTEMNRGQKNVDITVEFSGNATCASRTVEVQLLRNGSPFARRTPNRDGTSYRLEVSRNETADWAEGSYEFRVLADGSARGSGFFDVNPH